MNHHKNTPSLVALFIALVFAGRTAADEGMWLPDALPKARLAKLYGFEPDAKWVEHVQKSAVRFNSGGSGSFVSSDGLLMTNHHVGADTLAKLSTPQRNLYRDGFLARTRAEELKAPDLEVNVLYEIEDVTERVAAAIRPGVAQTAAARRSVMSAIEAESVAKTGLRSDVVTLWHGGRYHLYRYKKYTDVRLVWAPEFAIAFFGGDPDNFEYPRFDLDVCFFRAYEDGKPARPPHFFKWSAAGAAEGEPVIVAGHPGSTHRLNTAAQLKYQRDAALPAALDQLRRREVLLASWVARSKENARIAGKDLFGVQNSRKALLGKLAGLHDPQVMSRKLAEETELRTAVERDPKSKAEFADAWPAIAAAQQTALGIRRDLGLLEGGSAFNSRLFSIARTLVRMTAENAKPNAERLREYRESNLASIELSLFSAAPLYPEYEKLKLADSLALLAEQLGADHPTVRAVLGGKSPTNRAAELVDASKLGEVAARKALAAGGIPAINGSNDPMIALARLVDGDARRLRRVYEDQVEGVERTQFAKIAKAVFAVRGTDTYPDATFTLRLSFGTVKGYSEGGRTIPPWTDFSGAFARAAEHDNREPFTLPNSWHDRRNSAEAGTPFNFVSTNDIIGGNSGSPVINRKAEIVGLIFDGNIQSLAWDYAFTDEQARAVSVHSRAIIEALRKIYGATELSEELGK